jgi:hypothetical protein
MPTPEKIEFTVSETHEVLIHLIDFEAVCSTLPKMWAERRFNSAKISEAIPWVGSGPVVRILEESG